MSLSIESNNGKRSINNPNAISLGWNDESIKLLSRSLGEPEVLLMRRIEANKRFKSTPWPNPTQEAWRRIDPRRIGSAKFKLWLPSEDHDHQVTLPSLDIQMKQGWSRLDLLNGSVVSSDISSVHQSSGLFAGSLCDAFSSPFRDNLTNQILSAADDAESPAINLLQLAYYQGGYHINIPRNVDLSQPIWLRNFSQTPDSGLLNLGIISVQNGGHATVVIDNSCLGNNHQWWNGLTRVIVEDAGHLDLIILNRAGVNTAFYDHFKAFIGRDAFLHLTWADLTEGWAVVRREAVVTAEGGESLLRGVHIGSGDSTFNLRSLQDHPAPHTHSDLLYKAVLFDRSKSIYQGLIVVHPNSVGANAYQLNRNLLLSSQARADSIPMLEILVDEVRCTHGASAGKINPELLFYLMARGLNENQATQLMVEGFLQDAGSSLPEGEIKDFWRDEVIRVCRTALEREALLSVA